MQETVGTQALAKGTARRRTLPILPMIVLFWTRPYVLQWDLRPPVHASPQLMS